MYGAQGSRRTLATVATEGQGSSGDESLDLRLSEPESLLESVRAERPALEVRRRKRRSRAGEEP